MFEALLKYPPSEYARGVVELAWSWPAWSVAAAACVLLAWWLSGRGLATALGAGGRWLAVSLRVGLLVLLVTLLARPVLVVSTPESRRADVLVLVDGSLSMNLPDGDGATRAARAAARLHPREGDLAATLGERFDLRWQAYGRESRALAAGEWPAFDAPRSDLAAALRAVADGPARGSLAGVVLVSDGGDEGGELDDALLALRARQVPVHVLGAGAAPGTRDAAIVALDAPARVLAGDSAELALEVAASGLAGERVRLSLAVGGTPRLERELVLPGDGLPLRVQVPVTLTTPGVTRLEARISTPEGDAVAANDAAAALVQVLAEGPPVLHYEAEPRFEVKFVRRAVAEDDALALVSVVRTADNKYYRLGIEEEDELADGFPRVAPALFRFGVVVLGLSQVATLDDEQLALLEDYVARRGGALLLLGGPRAGQRLPATLARLSPLLPPAERGGAAAVRVRATAAAARHPVTRFLLSEQASTPLGELPPLTVASPVRAAKPGAEVLLEGERGDGEAVVVLATHRYGRGRVVAFAVRDSWRWQMHASVDPADPTHETLWRQLLRWLARQAPARTTLHTTPAVPVPGAPVRVRLDLRGEDWQPLTEAPAALAVSTPLGDRLTPALRPVQDEPGVYEAEFVPEATGAYELRAGESGAAAAPAEAWLEVSAEGREYRRTRQDEALLRHVAEATGSSYRPLAAADGLAADIDAAGGGATVTRRLPLWDLPLAWWLLVLLACSEWWLRRRRRLP